MVGEYDIVFMVVFYNFFFEDVGVFCFLLEIFIDYFLLIGEVVFQVNFVVQFIIVCIFFVYWIFQNVYGLFYGECDVIIF